MLTAIFRSKLMILGLVLIVLVGAWYGLSSSTGPAPVLTSSAADTSGDDGIVQTLLQLQAITLSGTIFSNPAFATLQDFTTAIVPVPAGRPDPFAPISATTQYAPPSTTTAAASKSASIFKTP